MSEKKYIFHEYDPDFDDIFASYEKYSAEELEKISDELLEQGRKEVEEYLRTHPDERR